MNKFKKINKFKKLFISIILIFVFIISLQNSFAADVNINNASSGGINGALTSASDGDNIILAPGTYNKINQDFNIGIGKNVTIKGNGPTNSVIIDAQNLSRILTIANNKKVTFINLTFINGLSYFNGGGIYGDAAIVTVINCSFVNCTALNDNLGGAIYNNFDLTVIGSNFTNNHANNSGGAIASNALLFVDKCVFINNSANNHAGAIDVQGNNSLIFNSIFNSNFARGGGAIWSFRENLTIKNCYFNDNYDYDSGGAIKSSGNNLRIESSIFRNNSAIGGYNSGGAISHAGDNGVFLNCSFIASSAYYYGGAIHTVGRIKVDNCSFINNTATRTGAISNNQASSTYSYIHVYNSIFIGNTATGAYDGVSYAGAIYSSSDNFIVYNCTFINNSASNAPGFAYTPYGGAIENGGPNALIELSTFINNFAHSGGAIYNYFANNLTIKNCIFTGNGAINGGAIASNNANNVIIDNCTFNNNNATSGGAIGNFNGVNFTTIDSIFRNNSAVNGGAIYNTGTGSSVRNSNFINNIASSYGGAIYNQGNMGVSGNTMIDNIAGLGNMIYNLGHMGVLTLTFIDNSTIFVNNGQIIVLFANLTDDMGNTITGQNISFFVNGTLIGASPSVEGYANISYNVTDVGTVPVTGDYGGHNGYLINILNGQLTTKIPTNSTIAVPNTVNTGVTIMISGVVVDINGNSLANIVVTVVVGNMSYNLTTASVGVWSLSYVTTGNGNISVLVSWTGDGTYFGFVNSTIFNVHGSNGSNNGSTGVGNGSNNRSVDVGNGSSNGSTGFGNGSAGLGNIGAVGSTNESFGVDDGSNDGSFDGDNGFSGDGSSNVAVAGGTEVDDDSDLGYATMKKTGMPIIAIIIILLSIGGLCVFRKKSK